MTRLLAAFAAAGLIGGCSSLDSLNPFGNKGDQRNLPAPLVELTGKTVEPKILWHASVGSAGAYVFTPAVAQSSVYAAAENGNVTRLDKGQQVWRMSTDKRVSGGVGSDGKVVAVGTDKGEVLALSASDGRLLWSAKAGSEILSAPLVTEGLVVVRSGDARIYAFDAADGKRRWVYQRTAPALSVRAAPGMVAMPGAILSGFPGGKLAAIALNNGAALWEFTVALPKGATELERVTDITSNPVVGGQEVCAVAYRGRAACFNTTNGQTVWARDASSFSGMELDSRTAYVSDESGIVMAFDRQAGASLWKQDKLTNRKLSRPQAIGAYIAVGDYKGYVHLLRREDGAFAGRVATDGSAIVASPIRIGDAVLVQTQDGGIYAIGVN
ncbi:MAG: outer membrane protein assembly factor BamB [Rhodocyclaceae bacterium]|nr:outer membrane protein assembly factor BamB [Rhodocyclaceae bacterium]